MIGSRVIYDYQVMQSGNVLDKGTNGLTVVKDGLVVRRNICRPIDWLIQRFGDR
jgi:hypothetical protein